MKRKVSPELFRRIVRARLTKGDAFSLSGADYDRRQHEVKAKLDDMSIEDIIKKHPHVVYDLKT